MFLCVIHRRHVVQGVYVDPSVPRRWREWFRQGIEVSPGPLMHNYLYGSKMNSVKRLLRLLRSYTPF